MALLSYYDIGFASVANGSTAVTGTSTQWLTALRENDVFVGADGRTARIASIESATSMTLARPWPGDSQTSDVYEVRITPAPSEITASVRELLEKLRQGLWLTPNATGTLAERAGYDSARRGFIYMQTDVDPFVVFVKQTDTAGDWSPGFSPQQGPAGPFTTIEIGTTTTLAPGAEATISPVQDGDTVTLNFGIPAGTIIEAGTTTTLAPDQPASVDFEPIPGGFTLNFNIPRGPTGDINGVTPFWSARLGADVDQAAARTGLGGTGVGNAVFTAANEAAGRTALGATSVGHALFIAANEATGRTAIGAAASRPAMSQAEAVAGTDTTIRDVTAQRLRQAADAAIAALGSKKIHRIYTASDTETFSTTSTTAYSSGGGSVSVIPSSPTSSILVICTAYMDVTGTGSIRFSARMNHFSGTEYVGSPGGTAAQYGYTNSSIAGSTTYRQQVTMTSLLDVSNRRTDTGAWLPRVGFSLTLGTTATNYSTNFIIVEFEP